MSLANALIIESDDSKRRAIQAVFGFLGYQCRFIEELEHPSLRASSDWQLLYLGTAQLNAEHVQWLQTRLQAPQPPLLLVDQQHRQDAGLPPSCLQEAIMVGYPLRSDDLTVLLQQQRLSQHRQQQSPSSRANQRRHLVGNSRPMQEIAGLIQQVAPFDASVLILGDSGTGKELVARTIHADSPRRQQPFVAINCGAIPAELLESELFGHEKGAFTGAISARKGRFELAEGGTLFLDEIGDMSLSMQVKLLRVLQERSFERVGGHRSQPCDVRIIAATHRNLQQAIGAGQFREDLFYRLNVFPLHVPALKQRIEDLPVLIAEFNLQLSQRGLRPVKLSDDALHALQAYSWPGNVRELSNLIERLAILYPRQIVRLRDLPAPYQPTPELSHAAASASQLASSSPPLRAHQASLPDEGLDLRDHLADIELNLIRQALDAADGVVARAAKLLSIQRTTLVEKLRKYGISNQGQLLS